MLDPKVELEIVDISCRVSRGEAGNTQLMQKSLDVPCTPDEGEDQSSSGSDSESLSDSDSTSMDESSEKDQLEQRQGDERRSIRAATEKPIQLETYESMRIQ